MMMLFKKCACISLLLAGSLAYAQDVVRTAHGIKAETCGMQVDIQFYSPEIVRVLKYQPGQAMDKNSYAVIARPGNTETAVRQEKDGVTVKSDSMQVHLDLATGRISCADIRGRQLLAEKDFGAQFTPVEYGGEKTWQVRQAFRLDPEEAVYGLGQHQRGKMNQRNQMLHLRQVNTDIAIPFFLSTRGYGLYWDNTSPTTFTDNPMETAFDSQTGRCIDYYVIAGTDADRVVRGMRELTGRVQMNALWTYGFWQSRERYTSQEQTVDVVRKYRELQVPLDGIIQDWQYWGEDNAMWNSVEFGNPRFQNPGKMIDDVHGMNAHIIISVWPSFGYKTPIYKKLKDEHLLLDIVGYPGEARPYDTYNPRAREIYWDYMKRNMLDLGMDGWWLDATEPENSDKDAKLDQQTHDGVFRNVCNAYPIVSVGGVYDNQRLVSRDKRVFILTRSAFAGQQRYGACSWSGDIHSTWDVLRKQISAGLNFSVCGIPYWNTDIGGFVAPYDGVNDVRYHELYVRWMQFGAFTPMMRSHGTVTPREVYLYGQRGTWAFDALDKYINLRYALLPYLYSTAWSVSKDDDTFMRPLFMDFAGDKAVLDMDNEYMFGRSFLVAPVTDPMYVDGDKKVDFTTVKSKPVYLPCGVEWYDFWTGERQTGGRTVQKACPIDIMPLYVKAGSVLPIGPKVQYAGEKTWEDLEIRVYPGADCRFVLYEDENDNYNYEQGAFSEIPFTWDDEHRTLTIGRRIGSFDGMLSKRRFRIVLVSAQNGVGDKPSAKVDRRVTYSGREVRVKL